MTKLLVDPAKPLQDPAADAAQRATCRALAQLMSTAGLVVPDAILAWLTPDDLPPDVAVYALADGAGLLPHAPHVLAKMGPDELAAEFARMTPDQVADAAKKMDAGQAAAFAATLAALPKTPDVAAALAVALAVAQSADVPPDDTGQAVLNLSR